MEPGTLRRSLWLFRIFSLMRNRVQILAHHPKPYWNEDTRPESEWIKLRKKVMPKDCLWTSMDEAEHINSVRENAVIDVGFQISSDSTFRPYDPLQQMTSAAVASFVFPLMTLTGLCMPPVLIARFPWYPKLFGGRQAARSPHAGRSQRGFLVHGTAVVAPIMRIRFGSLRFRHLWMKA
jgi:hypothetical protein